ncbi:MAG: glutathione binding-like protein, partial [Hyphomicrobiales bacterium]
GFGPILGQTHHFLKFEPGKAPYAEERFKTETNRLYGVLDKHLSETDYLAGEYSIADIAIWPWVSRYEWQNLDLNNFPAVKKWYQRIAEREAVQRGYKVPNDQAVMPTP